LEYAINIVVFVKNQKIVKKSHLIINASSIGKSPQQVWRQMAWLKDL
jgi:hypothetical protein